jgi:uncharacterized damage-inducible protein DinB
VQCTAVQPLKTYDYLVLARQRILDKVRTLSPEQYAQPMEIGHGSLDRTVTHILASEWYYVQRLLRREVPPYEQWAIRWEEPPTFATLEAAWVKQADETRAAIESVRDWLEPIEYRVTTDDGRRLIVTASAVDIITQLALHEVHHRAQVMNMLTRFGAGVGDIDYNLLMYQRRDAE